MPQPVSCCDACRHRHFENKAIDSELYSSCDSYPNGIPWRIVNGKVAAKFHISEDGADIAGRTYTSDGALCYGIDGINYLPMTEEERERHWEAQRLNDVAVKAEKP